jgi:hypothetical protein
MSRHSIRALVAAWLAVAAPGCAGSMDVARFQTDVATGRYEQALGHLDDEPDEDVAALLDRALLESALGRHAESNALFEAAEAEIDDLYTRSLTKEAVSMLTGDLSLDYRPPGFERAFIPYYRAWNYLEMGDRSGALVEARRIGERLDYESTTCSDEQGACAHDAFLRYFSGLLFEWGGEANDAYVSYKLADEAAATARERYGVGSPPDLGPRLVRLAAALGFGDEEEVWRERYGVGAPPETPRATVLVVLENGVVGMRSEASITLPIFKGESDAIAGDVDAWSGKLARRRHAHHYEGVEVEYLLRLAVPAYVDRPPPASRGRFTLGTVSRTTDRVENLSAMAAAGLEHAMGGILARTAARALTKYLAKRAADDKIGKGAGLVVNLLGAATERADTRSWRSLPHEIQMASLSVAPGTYAGKLEVLGPEGRVLTEVFYEAVEAKAGGVTFVRHRTGS